MQPQAYTGELIATDQQRADRMSNIADLRFESKSGARKVWPLTGGVHPPENKFNSPPERLFADIAPLPKQSGTLPLSQHAGAPAEPVVQGG